MVMNMQNTKMFLLENYLMVVLAAAVLLVAASIGGVMVRWRHGDLNQYSIQLNSHAVPAATVVAPAADRTIQQ